MSAVALWRRQRHSGNCSPDRREFELFTWRSHFFESLLKNPWEWDFQICSHFWYGVVLLHERIWSNAVWLCSCNCHIDQPAVRRLINRGISIGLRKHACKALVVRLATHSWQIHSSGHRKLYKYSPLHANYLAWSNVNKRMKALSRLITNYHLFQPVIMIQINEAFKKCQEKFSIGLLSLPYPVLPDL